MYANLYASIMASMFYINYEECKWFHSIMVEA